MKTVKTIRRIFAVCFILTWFSYAFMNLSARFPYLKVSFFEGWDIASTYDAVISTAEGGVVFQDTLQDAYGYLSHYLNKQANNDFTIIKGENGRLLYTSFYPYESYSFTDEALRLKKVQESAFRQGASFLYVNVIDLYQGNLDTCHGFPINNLNPRSDALLYNLGGYEIDYMDTRTVLNDSGLDASEYNYQTDPHWTIQASFESYLAILDWLKADGVNIDPDGFFSDRGNFTQTEYPAGFIGETGKRMGLPYQTAEDFTLITPDFDTDFTVEYAESDIHEDRTGDFSSALLDMDWMSLENPYERNMYSVYLTGEHSFRRITNNLNADGPGILLLGDSNMLPVAAFLASAAGEVELLWPYTIPDDYSLEEYINSNQYDAVIIGMSPGLLYGSGLNYLADIEPVKVSE